MRSDHASRVLCAGPEEVFAALVERVRRDARDDVMSIRALADKHKVHRRTVRAALGAEEAESHRSPVWQRPLEEEDAVVAESSVRNRDGSQRE